MNGISIISGNSEKCRALSRYLEMVMGMKNVMVNPFPNPYRQKDAYDQADQSDLLIVDAFIKGNPGGFQFAKLMEKRALLLFSPGEMKKEFDCAFCLLLPRDLPILGDRIEYILKKTVPSQKDFEDLEKRFPILKDLKEHQ